MTVVLLGLMIMTGSFLAGVFRPHPKTLSGGSKNSDQKDKHRGSNSVKQIKIEI